MVESDGVLQSRVDHPLLRDLQEQDPRQPRIQANLKRSGGRRSSALIVAIHLALLSAGALIAAVVLEAVAVPQAALSVVGVLATVGASGRYRTRMVPDVAGHLPRLAVSVAAGSAIPYALLAVTDAELASFRSYAATTAVLFACSLVGTWLSVAATRRLWARGRLRSRAVILGSGPLAREFAVELRLRREYGVDLVDVVELTGKNTLAEDLVDAVDRSRADRVIVAPLEEETGEGPPLVHAARRVMGYGIPVFIVPRLYELGLGLDSMSPDRARGYPLVRVQRSAHPTVTLRVKRAVDIVVSGLLLLILAPVLSAAAVAVAASSRGPMLFRQPRVGQNGREFDMLKFRSMTVGENDHRERFSGHRVTRVGRLLRATSIDELPQLWNIFRGDMSLVGPRPERVGFVEEGLGLYEGYAERHRMPMGLTGLAQVVGLRGEDTSVQERVKFDNLYIDQWSLALDAQVVLETVFAIVFQGRYRRRERELSDALTELPPDVAVIDLTHGSE